MTKLLPVDVIIVEGQFKVVCFEVEFFKPDKPFFVDDLYSRFPTLFNSAIEQLENAFVRKMYFSNDERIKFLTIDEYITRFSIVSPERKIGFIFHMSRCGSTLFSNLLKCSSDITVFSEPTIINSVLDPTKDISSIDRQALIYSSIKALSNFSPNNNLTIIKFRSWNIYFIDIIYSGFGFIPSIFIHRNGLEVLSSIMKKRPGWLRAKITCSKFFGGILECSKEDVIKMNDQEYVLRILKSFVEKIIKFKRQKIVSIEYSTLKNEFIEIVNEVFSVRFSEKELEILKEKMKEYSKGENRLFFEDGLKKREEYGSDLVELNENLVEDLRKKL